jgi:Protein of unknown function (DUF1549)/Protein of unknown function (DUF1553)
MLRLILMFTSLAIVSPLRAGELANEVDSILANTASEQGLQAAPICSDEQFLRRATLDLAGRIPTVSERTAFLSKPDRAALVDQLLASDEFPRMWSDLWTTQWYGYLDDDASDRDGLAGWLEAEIRAKRPYDELVQTLVSATGESAFDGPVNFLLRHPDEPIVKISRAFLGVRLDCARCHDHPFDRWKQEDFTRMSRFFDGLERRDVSQGNTQLVDVVREVAAEERPRFLTGAQPRTTQWRSEFSLFLVKSRPFARNFANRLWYHLLGRGIVHPVDDVSRDNPPVIPELLEWLTDEVVRSDFDLRHLLRLICLTEAYQRESLSTRDDDKRRELFLVRTIKPLPAEQWYMSMCLALKRNPNPEERLEFVRTFHGDALDGDFSSSWDYRETVQGLMSRLVEGVDPPSRDTNELFLSLLGRSPTSEEQTLCEKLTPREITFMLLNSSEFAFNH